MAEDFSEVNGHRMFLLTTTARWALLPFSILAGYICWRWAGQLFGPASGILALWMWCFCPFVIANAEIVTGDMGSTALILASCYYFWRWSVARTWKGAILTGFVLGLAELAKYVSVILYPLFVAMWIASMALNRNEPERRWKREAQQLFLLIIISFYVINWGYLFDGTCSKLGEFQAGRDALAMCGFAPETAQESFLSRIPVPLPYDYVKGIDEIREVTGIKFRMYFDGVWHVGGWWHYFLDGFAIKLPLGTLLVIELAIVLTVISRTFRLRPWDELAILLPLIVILVFVSTITSIQYLRYGLPVIPFLFIWSSRVAKATEPWLALIVCAAISWSIVSTISVFPHSGSYFNEIAGGPENGSAYLLESSIDWGQDMLYAKKWLNGHPEATPFHFAYFGHFDPRYADIDFSLPPTRAELSSHNLNEGWYAVSVSLLRGFGWPVVPDGNGALVNITSTDYSYFLEIEPTDRIGYSINVYHLDSDDIDMIYDRLSLPRKAD